MQNIRPHFRLDESGLIVQSNHRVIDMDVKVHRQITRLIPYNEAKSLETFEPLPPLTTQKQEAKAHRAMCLRDPRGRAVPPTFQNIIKLQVP